MIRHHDSPYTRKENIVSMLDIGFMYIGFIALVVWLFEDMVIAKDYLGVIGFGLLILHYQEVRTRNKIYSLEDLAKRLSIKAKENKGWKIVGGETKGSDK